MGYVEAKYKIPTAVLKSAILSAEGLVEKSDAEVYRQLQALQEE